MSALEELANVLLRFVEKYNALYDRVEKMEKNPLANFVHIDDNGQAVLDASMLPTFDVIVKSSDAFQKMEKALSEEMARTRELDGILAGVVKKIGYVSPELTLDQKTLDDIVANPGDYEVKTVTPVVDPELKFTTSGPCHTICIMPNGNPSGIPFSVALEYLRAGRKLTHPSFEKGNSIEVLPPNFILMHWLEEGRWTNFVMDSALALSDAWMVLPETQNQ